MDLSRRYDHSGIGGGSLEAPGSPWTTYDRVVLAHALCGFIAWQVAAPIAVLLAATGRSWGAIWFRLHWMLQLLITLPLTIAGVVLGLIAAKIGEDGHFSLHKGLGLLLLLLTFLQVGLGYYTHLTHQQEKYNTPLSQSFPIQKRRVANYIHIIIGLGLLALGGVQVGLGFREYTARKILMWIKVVHWIVAGAPILIFTPFVIYRAYKRLRAGHSFLDSVFTPRLPPPSEKLTPNTNFPAKKMWLGSEGSNYRELAGEGDGEDGLEMNGSGVKRPSIGGSHRSSWTGHETREDYEDSLGVGRNSTSGDSRNLGNVNDEQINVDQEAEEGQSLLANTGGKSSNSSKPAPTADPAWPLLSPNPSISSFTNPFDEVKAPEVPLLFVFPPNIDVAPPSRIRSPELLPPPPSLFLPSLSAADTKFPSSLTGPSLTTLNLASRSNSDPPFSNVLPRPQVSTFKSTTPGLPFPGDASEVGFVSSMPSIPSVWRNSSIAKERGLPFPGEVERIVGSKSDVADVESDTGETATSIGVAGDFW